MEKGATRIVDRTSVSWIEMTLISIVNLATGWFIGWSPFIEPHWAGRWLGMIFVVIAVWTLVFAVIQTNRCLIHSRKRTITSTITTWYFKKITTQYSWDQFCAVRTVLEYAGERQKNRVELVSKDMCSSLTIASFLAVTKPGGLTLFAAYKYENPLATQMRNELSMLMSLSDQGYSEERYNRQLQ